MGFLFAEEPECASIILNELEEKQMDSEVRIKNKIYFSTIEIVYSCF